MKILCILLGTVVALFVLYFVYITLIMNTVYNCQHNKKVLAMFAKGKLYRGYARAWITPNRYGKVYQNFVKMFESQFEYDELNKEV